MSVVYVPHQPMRMEDGDWVPTVDLSSAADFGELRFVMPPGEPPDDPAAIFPRVLEALAGFRAEDYVLAVGSPALIGIICAAAAKASGGYLRVLRWRGRGRDGHYRVVAGRVW